MSATREAYIRGCATSGEAFCTRSDSTTVGKYECHIGVEMHDGDDVEKMSSEVQEVAHRALYGEYSHRQTIRFAEHDVKKLWPGRAYFIETDIDGRGVQVYQPFGMPRNPVTK